MFELFILSTSIVSGMFAKLILFIILMLKLIVLFLSIILRLSAEFKSSILSLYTMPILTSFLFLFTSTILIPRLSTLSIMFKSST